MLWHRKMIFESKGDKWSSSVECRIEADRLIFNMGILIPGKDDLYIEMGPRIQLVDPNTT